MIGKTAENRDMKTLVFRKGNPQRKIWIDCGKQQSYTYYYASLFHNIIFIQVF